jgi:putative isomerase
MDTLAKIAEAIGKAESAMDWRTRANELLKLLLAELWQDGTWRVIAPAMPESEPAPGADSLLPYVALVLGERLPKDVLDASVQQLTRDNRFLTEHGLATESVSSPFYEDDGYWRGPIWAPSSMLIIDGLARAGEVELARRLSHSFCEMCRAYGLAENYDAQTGVGLRDRGYTWTASVFLELASRLMV